MRRRVRVRIRERLEEKEGKNKTISRNQREIVMRMVEIMLVITHKWNIIRKRMMIKIRRIMQTKNKKHKEN